MLRLSSVLIDLIRGNPLLTFGLHNKLFNLSQLALYLQPLIEVQAKKQLSTSAIVMALSRLQKEIHLVTPMRDAFRIEHLGIQTGLTTCTFEKTDSAHKGVGKLYAYVQKKNGYITVSEATSQITIIVDASFTQDVLRCILQKPLFTNERIASISITFDESYIEVPGMIYIILQQITLLGINIVEIASTFTELVLYIEEKDTKAAFDALYELFALE